MLDKEKDKEDLTVLGRTLKEIEAGLERAFEEFLQEYPDISREEAQKAWKAAGAPSRVEPWRRWLIPLTQVCLHVVAMPV